MARRPAPISSRPSTPLHGGKLSLARVLSGSFTDGTTVHGGADDERISGLFTLMGQEPTKRGEAKPGDTVALRTS